VIVADGIPVASIIASVSGPTAHVAALPINRIDPSTRIDRSPRDGRSDPTPSMQTLASGSDACHVTSTSAPRHAVSGTMIARVGGLHALRTGRDRTVVLPFGHGLTRSCATTSACPAEFTGIDMTRTSSTLRGEKRIRTATLP
jgi:hypothetical protein